MLNRRDMGRRYFSQKSTAVSGHPCSNHGHPFALFDKAGLRKDFPAALIAKKVCININRQGKTLTLFSEFGGSNSQYGGGYVGQPEHGPSRAVEWRRK